MFVNKAAWLFAVLLALLGCGQDDETAGNITEPAALPDAPGVSVAGATDAGEVPDQGNAQTALAGRAEYMQGLLTGCVNHDYPELEKVKRQQFCDCFHAATYASMTDAEWVEWDAIMVEKGRIWGAGFDRVFAIATENKPEPAAPNPELQERLDRFDADWQQRYTRNENACMKKLGVTVKLTDQP